MRYRETMVHSTAGRAAGIAVLIAAICAFSAAAQDADVVYTEGDVRTKTTSGSIEETYIGDALRSGESVITGGSGFAELEQGGNSTIRVGSDTHFVIQEREVDGETRQVMETAAGSVAFRFRRMTRKEPIIQSPSAVAGVRGTEFTVYAGADGSSMILVDSGLVEVEGKGKKVNLEAEQGVEIPAGEAPGEVFEWKGKELDYSTWNSQKIDAFLEDPVRSLERIGRRLADFQKEVEKLYPEFNRRLEISREMRKEFSRIEEKEGREKAIEYRDRELTPYIQEMRLYILNGRYYALSALSLRRHVLSAMYVQMKSTYIGDLENVKYREFIDTYNDIIDSFEETIAIRLVEADI